MTNGIAVQEPSKTELQFRNGEIQLENLSGAYRYAQYAIKSQLVPRGFDTPEKVLICWQHGAELGLKPMQSLKSICVINGRPALYGDAVKGICLNRGVVEDWQEHFEGADDTLTAICKVKRKDIPSYQEGRFSVADAKAAGLWGKDTWKNYPKDMMMHKARKRAAAMFADVLCGLPVLEDIEEVPAERHTLSPEIARVAEPDPLMVEMKVDEPVTVVVDTSDRTTKEDLFA